MDAHPYLVAAVTLAAALDGVADPSPAASGDASGAGSRGALPRNWLEAIDALDQSQFARRVLGDLMHPGFVAMKRSEHDHMAVQVSEAEWAMYGFVA